MKNQVQLIFFPLVILLEHIFKPDWLQWNSESVLLMATFCQVTADAPLSFLKNIRL